MSISSSYQSMMNNNNITSLSTTSTGSSVSNSSSGSTGGSGGNMNNNNNTNAPMSLAAANVVRGIMEKVLQTPPMGSGLISGNNPPTSLSNSNTASSRLFNEIDYLSSPGLDSDFGDVSPLLCPGSNLSNQYLRLTINNNNKEQQQCHHGNFLSR